MRQKNTIDREVKKQFLLSFVKDLGQSSSVSKMSQYIANYGELTWLDYYDYRYLMDNFSQSEFTELATSIKKIATILKKNELNNFVSLNVLLKNDSDKKAGLFADFDKVCFDDDFEMLYDFSKNGVLETLSEGNSFQKVVDYLVVALGVYSCLYPEKHLDKNQFSG